jgi:hypothetical protein
MTAATHSAVLPGIEASAPPGISRPRMSNPMPVAFALFGSYTLILIIPVAIFAVPEFVRLDFLFMIAFAAIIVLLLLLGLAFRDLNHDVVSATLAKRPPDLSGVANLLHASAWMGSWRRAPCGS